MFLKVISETTDPFQDHSGRFITNSTVCGIENITGRLFDKIDHRKISLSVQNLFHQFLELSQANSARYTFPTGLGVAEFQKR